MKKRTVEAPTEAAAALPLAAPPKLRRRPVLIAFGVVLVVVGAIVMWYVVTMVKDTTQVVAARVDVARGEVIELSDLTTVEIRPDPLLQTIPAADLSALVGQRALADLSAGSIVVPAALTEQLLPEPGQALVGAPLTLGQQMPGIMPRIGQPVSLVPTPRDDPAQAPNPELTRVYEATVVAVTSLSETQIALTVSVPVADAARLTRLAAAGQIAVYFDSEG
jgi:hypothetical protein